MRYHTHQFDEPFELRSDSLVVAHPWSSVEHGAAHIIQHAKKGTWYAHTVRCGMDGHVARFTVYHQSVMDGSDVTLSDGPVTALQVDDYAVAGIFDMDSYRDGTALPEQYREIAESPGNQWAIYLYDMIESMPFSGYITGCGAASTTNEAGEYSCYVGMNEAGEIVQVQLVFADVEEEDIVSLIDKGQLRLDVMEHFTSIEVTDLDIEIDGQDTDDGNILTAIIRGRECHLPFEGEVYDEIRDGIIEAISGQLENSRTE